MPLTVDTAVILAAWQQAETYKADYFAHHLAVNDRLGYGQQAVTTHRPEDKSWGVVCDNCGAGYPCWLASWGMGLLKSLGWQEKDLLALFASDANGDQP